MTKKDRSPEPVEVLPQQSTSTEIQGADVTEIPDTVVVVDGNTYYVSFDLFPSLLHCGERSSTHCEYIAF